MNVSVVSAKTTIKKRKMTDGNSRFIVNDRSKNQAITSEAVNDRSKN